MFCFAPNWLRSAAVRAPPPPPPRARYSCAGWGGAGGGDVTDGPMANMSDMRLMKRLAWRRQVLKHAQQRSSNLQSAVGAGAG